MHRLVTSTKIPIPALIGTSFYVNDQLFLLGLDGADIEEFDEHVIVHEWGHYFEDNLSRSDSIGGAHGQNDRLDARVAYGEGFASAWAAMARQDPLYCDAFWFNGQLRGGGFSAENDFTGGFAGWYNEFSVIKILYDLWDTDIDGADTSNIPFADIYAVQRNHQANTPAFTTNIFVCRRA